MDPTVPLLPTPPTYNRLDLLPVPLMLQIYSCMDNRSIGNSAQLSKHFAKTIQQAHHYTQWRMRMRRLWCQAIGRKVLRAFLGGFQGFSCILCGVIFCILLPLKLDQDLPWSWGTVFSPLLLTFHQTLLAPLVYSITRTLCEYDFDGEFESNPIARFFTTFLNHGKPSSSSHFFLFAPILSLLAFTILLLSHLHGFLGNWWLILSPLLVVVSVATLSMINRNSSNKGMIAISGGFLASFVLLLTMKLQYNIPSSWFTAMSPLLAFNLCIFITSQRLSREIGWTVLGDLVKLVGSTLAVVLLSMEVLLAIHLDYDFISFKSIFLPLLVLCMLVGHASLVQMFKCLSPCNEM